MQGKLSRRKIAKYVADSVCDGAVPSQVIDQLSAYLIETKRQRELTLVVRSIEDELTERGTVVASVVSAFPLGDELRSILTAKINAPDVRLHEVIDPSVIGGVRLTTPSATLDTTIAHKLTLLQDAKL